MIFPSMNLFLGDFPGFLWSQELVGTLFQIHSIAKASKGVIMEYIVISTCSLPLPLLPWLHPLPFLVSLPVRTLQLFHLTFSADPW